MSQDEAPRSPILGLPFTTVFLRKFAVGLALAALFTWLALRDPQPAPTADDLQLVRREFLAMGTLFSIDVYLDNPATRADAELAVNVTQALLADYERRWDAWGDGELGRINAALARGEAVEIPQALRTLFARAARYGADSGHRFDVRVGELVRLWGFDDELHFRSEPPAAAEIARLRDALSRAPSLSPAADTYGPAEGVQFDFGAIAKGDATDVAIAALRAAGFANAIVNAGGNLRADGRHGDRAWRIGIRHPRPDEHHRLLASLELNDNEAVVTSGDYERYFESAGVRYHHLLDPQSGQPARGLESVTVVADNGALADAASTALFVAGPDHWRAVAEAMGVSQVVVVDEDGRIQATPALAPRLALSDGLALSP